MATLSGNTCSDRSMKRSGVNSVTSTRSRTRTSVGPARRTLLEECRHAFLGEGGAGVLGHHRLSDPVGLVEREAGLPVESLLAYRDHVPAVRRDGVVVSVASCVEWLQRNERARLATLQRILSP